MKYKFILYCVIVICFACKKNKPEVDYSVCYIDSPEDVYDYPIKPGMPEWAEFRNSDEMVAATQLPENVLSTISTEGLIETVLRYPLYAELYLIEDYQNTFNNMKDRFNGLEELLKREDAAEKLLNRYKIMYAACFENNWPSILEDGSSNEFSFAYIEIILAQYDILNQLDEIELESMFKEALRKYKVKKQYNNYSIFSIKHSACIMARILLLKENAQFISEYNNNFYLKDFTDMFILYGNYSTLDFIYELSEKGFNKN